MAIASHMSRGLREGGLIVLGAIALYLLIALLSYAPTDPGWSRSGTGAGVANVGGVGGGGGGRGGRGRVGVCGGVGGLRSFVRVRFFVLLSALCGGWCGAFLLLSSSAGPARGGRVLSPPPPP